CLDGEAKHGEPDATFERGPNANIHDPRSLVCPRRGGTDTLPEVDVQVTDMTRKPPATGSGPGKPRQ
ncbi:MAG: hypothetical protein K8T20_17890, partial [Planctomycetes bacterium]|nr:hypothetical protein [Planctomycetota bacterium]